MLLELAEESNWVPYQSMIPKERTSNPRSSQSMLLRPFCNAVVGQGCCATGMSTKWKTNSLCRLSHHPIFHLCSNARPN